MRNAVCLKMFDEALLPAPGYEAFKGDHDIFFNPIRPNERLLNLNFTDDMMHREYAVSNRLEYLQGTLLPHAYGFHESLGDPPHWKNGQQIHHGDCYWAFSKFTSFKNMAREFTVCIKGILCYVMAELIKVIGTSTK
ncbi:hypothetical protein E1B28_000021 [Marasmius oreades]|uniref:Uncharacterized protein n=1 Tax=Marasmius oreades TaxID=181124 RepID=A0A9P7V0L0_9AGAR|nr:uncharacterized protein E1B28_000021 [Marasmius oreades]KAG7098047.1 hypothetical protein E1B28_000021 [Marasmius oreades]